MLNIEIFPLGFLNLIFSNAWIQERYHFPYPPHAKLKSYEREIRMSTALHSHHQIQNRDWSETCAAADVWWGGSRLFRLIVLRSFLNASPLTTQGWFHHLLQVLSCALVVVLYLIVRTHHHIPSRTGTGRVPVKQRNFTLLFLYS